MNRLRHLMFYTHALRAFLCSLGIAFITSCSSGGSSNEGVVSYRLHRNATNTLNNFFLLDIKGNFYPKFSLSGSGFQADVPLDTIVEARESTGLLADDFGEVRLKINLYQENNQAYLTDTLQWKSSPEVPPDPIASFSENASSDDWIFLVLPKSRGKNVQEVWVEGDLDPTVAKGKYYPIPGDDQVLLQLSDGDGLKSLKIRYRNIFDTESTTVEATILRKEQKPLDCKILPIANSTATGYLRAKIQATNDGPLYYKVAGDVARSMDFKKFENSIDELIGLSPGQGLKNLVFKIKDDAQNFCDDIPLKILNDTNYISGRVSIRNKALWTETSVISIDTHYDHLDGDNIHMFVKGDVQPSNETFQWIPLRSGLDVTLNPSSGNRHITVVYRKDSTDMAEVTVPIFLRPFLVAQGQFPNFNLLPSDIDGLLHMSITGCVESYEKIAFASPIPCTAAQGANAASVTYVLKDGTSLTRSASF